MPLFASTAALRIVDSLAIVLSQAMQLARARLASAASPVLRMMAERDHAVVDSALLQRELNVLRGQRQMVSAHRRPDYSPGQRLEILQIMRLRDWGVAGVAKRFALHQNTVRSWIKAVEGRGHERLLSPAITWNRIDDAVRWAAQELRRLCPEPEFGTRTIARHLVRAGIAISRTTVQRVLREAQARQAATQAARSGRRGRRAASSAHANPAKPSLAPRPDHAARPLAALHGRGSSRRLHAEAGGVARLQSDPTDGSGGGAASWCSQGTRPTPLRHHRPRRPVPQAIRRGDEEPGRAPRPRQGPPAFSEW